MEELYKKAFAIISGIVCAFAYIGVKATIKERKENDARKMQA